MRTPSWRPCRYEPGAFEAYSFDGRGKPNRSAHAEAGMMASGAG